MTAGEIQAEAGTSPDLAVQARVQQEGDTLSGVRQALLAELERHAIEGFGERLMAPFTLAELRPDTLDNSKSLYAEWRDARGTLLGSILLHEGGQVFAEYDVLLPHPARKAWFIEAVSAWGTRQAIKAELRLLPALGE